MRDPAQARTHCRFDAAHAPDAWFSAGAVWEVRCADLSLSPAHRAALGLVDRDKGISLRFPRHVHFSYAHKSAFGRF